MWNASPTTSSRASSRRFRRAVKLKPDEVVVFSWIVYKSRTQRDSVNAKVMKDPRLADDDGSRRPCRSTASACSGAASRRCWNSEFVMRPQTRPALRCVVTGNIVNIPEHIYISQGCSNDLRHSSRARRAWQGARWRFCPFFLFWLHWLAARRPAERVGRPVCRAASAGRGDGRAAPVAAGELRKRPGGSREVEVRARVTGILVTRNYRRFVRACWATRCSPFTRVPFQTALHAPRPTVALSRPAMPTPSGRRASQTALDEGMFSKRDYDDAIAAEQVAAADMKARCEGDGSPAQPGLYARRDPVSGLAGAEPPNPRAAWWAPTRRLTHDHCADPSPQGRVRHSGRRARALSRPTSRQSAWYRPQRFAVEVAGADGIVLERAASSSSSSQPLADSLHRHRALAGRASNVDQSIKPGQFVRVRLAARRRGPSAVQIPQRAVMEGPQGEFVYVVAPSDKPEMNRRWWPPRGLCRQASGWT